MQSAQNTAPLSSLHPPTTSSSPAARSPLDKRETQAGINLLGKQAGAAESIAARCHGAVAQRGGLAAVATPPGGGGSTRDVWPGGSCNSLQGLHLLIAAQGCAHQLQRVWRAELQCS